MSTDDLVKLLNARARRSKPANMAANRSGYCTTTPATTLLNQEMGFEGFRSREWPRLGRQQHSKSGGFPDSKRSGEGKSVKSAEAASGRKLVLLHDWWLVKADPDSHGKRLGIGGFILKENKVSRSFSSAPIVNRQDAVTLQTVDSITIMVHGYLNRSRTLGNGFSQEVCDHFLIGFPYYWEEFASLSVSEEPDQSSASKGVSPSYSFKTPVQAGRTSNMTNGNTFDAIPTTEASSAKKETSVAVQSMDSAVHRRRMAEKKRRNRSIIDGGPLTRSRRIEEINAISKQSNRFNLAEMTRANEWIMRSHCRVTWSEFHAYSPTPLVVIYHSWSPF